MEFTNQKADSISIYFTERLKGLKNTVSLKIKCTVLNFKVYEKDPGNLLPIKGFQWFFYKWESVKHLDT